MSVETEDADGLAAKTRRGMSWTAAASLASNAIRLAVLAVMGRILAPEDFGVVAAAMTVIQFGNILKDLGVGLALVQRRDVEPEHVQAAFSFSILLGMGFAAVTVVLAEPIAGFFNMTTSISIIRVLALMFVLRGVAVVPDFMCRREMNFRAIALIDLFSYLLGAVLSVTLALGGMGPWSLVAGYLLDTMSGVIMLMVVSPPPRKLAMPRKHLRDLLGFGVGKSLANIGNYFANQGDYMVVGHYLDKTQLGLYQRAYDLVRFPANVFSSVAGSVLFSAVSKVQDDPERMGRVFRRGLFASAVVLLPAAAGLIVLAPEVIALLLGPKWDGAVWPFRIMATTMLFRTTYKLGGLVGRSAGEVFTIAGWNIAYAVSVIGGALLSYRWGILGVACTTALAVVVNFFAMSRIGLRMTNLRALDLLRAHIEPVGFAALVGGVALAVATGMRWAGAPYGAVAGVTTVVGSAVFLVLAWLGLRSSRADWPWLADTFRQTVARRRGNPKSRAS